MANFNLVRACESWEEEGPLIANRYGSVSGSVSIVSDPVKNSLRAVRLQATSSRSWIRVSSSASGQDTSTYFRFNILPVTDVDILTNGHVSGTTNFRGLAYNSITGKLRPYAKDSTATDFGPDGSITVQAGVWYLIEYDRRNSSIAWQMAEEDNALVDEGEWIHPAKSGGAVGRVFLGNLEGAIGTFDLYFGATIVVDNQSGRVPVYPMGHHGVRTLRLNGIGTHINPNDFTDDVGNSPPISPETRLDDSPETTTDTDFVKQTTPSLTSYLEYTMDDLPIEAQNPVLAVQGWVGGNAEATAITQLAFGLVLDGVFVDVFSSAANNPTKQWFKGAPLFPETTVASVNAMLMRHGFDNDTVPNYRIRSMWTNVGYTVEVEEDGYWEILLE